METKQNLTQELSAVVKLALKEGSLEGIPLSFDIVDRICNITDAIFIHGLRDQHFLKGSRYAKYPEPNFWPFVSRFARRDVSSQIKKLSQIKNDIGRARAFVRITLTEYDMGYHLAMISKEKTVRLYYKRQAYLRDPEQVEILIGFMKGLSKVKINAPVNSAFLNQWIPMPLQLAGLTAKHNKYGPGIIPMDEIAEDEVASDALELDYNRSVVLSDDSSEISVTESGPPMSNSSFSVGSPYGAFVTPAGENFRGSSSASGRMSHMSIFDSEFAKILREVTVQRSGESSSGTPAPMGEEETQDSGIESAPKGTDVVVHRSYGHSTGNKRRERKEKFVDSGTHCDPSPSPRVSHVLSPTVSQGSSRKVSRSQSPEVSHVLSPNVSCSRSLEVSHVLSPNVSRSRSPEMSPGVSQTETAIEKTEIAVQTLEEELAEAEAKNSQLENTNDSFTSATEDMETAKEENLNSAPSSYKFGNSLDAIKSRASMDNDLEESPLDKCDTSSVAEGSFESTIIEFLQTKFQKEKELYAEGGAADHVDSTGVQFTEQMNHESTEIGHPVGGDTQVGAFGPPIERTRDRSPEDFVVVEEKDIAESEQNAQDVYTRHKTLLVRIANQNGLDAQNFQCLTCKRYIGLDFTYGAFRVCSFDGCYYCTDCHRNEEMLMPARMILDWDLTPRKVSRAGKAFLDHVADRPLIHLDQVNPTIYEHVEELNETFMLREKLSLVAMYLLTCKEEVAEDLRKRLWPKEYLYEDINLYSVNDLISASSGALQKHVKSVIQYATSHVAHCRLCSQKGFICETCNHKNIIFPFQVETTFRCPKCYSVFHQSCIKNRPCPKCQRRESYHRESRNSVSVGKMMDSLCLDDS